LETTQNHIWFFLGEDVLLAYFFKDTFSCSQRRKGMKIWTYERAKDFKCKKILNNIHQNNDSQLALT